MYIYNYICVYICIYISTEMRDNRLKKEQKEPHKYHFKTLKSKINIVFLMCTIVNNSMFVNEIISEIINKF